MVTLFLTLDLKIDIMRNGTLEAADRYLQAKCCAAVSVTEVKSQAWDKFTEVMERDFQLNLKEFEMSGNSEGGSSPLFVLFALGMESC